MSLAKHACATEEPDSTKLRTVAKTETLVSSFIRYYNMPTNKLYWKGFNDAKYGNYYLDSNWTKEELEEWTRGYKAYKKSDNLFVLHLNQRRRRKFDDA